MKYSLTFFRRSTVIDQIEKGIPTKNGNVEKASKMLAIMADLYPQILRICLKAKKLKIFAAKNNAKIISVG
jgi:hypothetical protein